MSSKKELLNVIILGAGKPLEGKMHSALNVVGQGGYLMDWLLQSLPPEVEKIQFVGGYKIREVESKYPRLCFVENKNWRNTGATGSLLIANIPEHGKLLVSYSDILYRSSIVDKLLNVDSDVVVAIDSLWVDRFKGRTEEDINACEKTYVSGSKITRLGPDIDRSLANSEFIGLLCFNLGAIEKIRAISDDVITKLNKTNLSGLVEWLRLEGLSVSATDVNGDWAQLDDPKDLAHFVLGTKAQTLERLQRLVSQSRIEKQVTFTVAEWKAKKGELLERLSESFQNNMLIVRSSALSEDGFSTANAGTFQSVLNVSCKDIFKLSEAIGSVIASYHDENPDNQVLVQKMVTGIKVSGVVFTRTLSYGAPYYVVNYDDTTGNTDTITSGNSNEHKTLIIRKEIGRGHKSSPLYMHNLISAVKEIEFLVNYDSLDIEFAINDQNEIIVFQVRPIAVDHATWTIEDKEFYGILDQIRNQYERLQAHSPFIKGSKAIFGIMPDWNPAEIIGTKPGKLATTLYSYLILDDVWATQRAEYGYKDIRPHPLLISFAGHPYIDIRASFNSFIPESLSPVLTEKLVTFYTEQLYQSPHLHDKIEFDIVPTCFGFDRERWEGNMCKNGGFSKSEIDQLFDALKTITVKAFFRNEHDLKSLSTLDKRLYAIKKSQVSSIDKVWLLLEDCRRYGTLAFSHLARSAFVAITLLRSAVWKGVISKAEMDDFLSTIQTVSNQISFDSKLVASGSMKWKKFVERYGHLRPGTYDITSETYADDPEKYFTPMVNREVSGAQTSATRGKLWASAKQRFFDELKGIGLPCEENDVLSFMTGAIEGREYAKFIFSRNLSYALDSIANFGEEMGVTREQLSHVGIEDLLSVRKGFLNTMDIKSFLVKRSEEGSQWKNLIMGVELPPLLFDANDISAFVYPATKANYIGSGVIKADCVNFTLKDITAKELDINGKIVIIPQADPGYDWLFGQNIAGLITMYGGANSHMAIRAAEFGLPAAIGVGETEYRRISNAKIIELNAGNRQINIVQE